MTECRCATLRPGDDCPAHPFDPTQYRRGCRACGAPDHPSGCATDLPNVFAAAAADQPGDEADDGITADTACECEHNRGYHDALGNCWHMDQAGAEDCDCDQFRPPSLSGNDWTVELGGQIFTRTQWEAVQTYVEGTPSEPLPDAATWSYAPSAGQGTGQMRDEIAGQLRRDYESEYATDEPVSAWYPQTDRILALPALRQLIAERDDLRRELDQARGQVQRVRDLIAKDDWSYAGEIRDALDGDS